jgi:RNA-directed DNA polymerase
MTQCLEELLPRLERLGEVAKRDKSLKFTNLLHHISLLLLQKAFYQLNKKAAKGVDDLGWHDYEKDVLTRLKALHQRIQSGRYKAQPVKRLWIPKGNGEERPIGVTAIEDKIVQQCVVWLLTPIYETDFLGFSYGFRPERNQHQALDAVYMAVTVKKVSWILDADLKGFFDRIDHDWMMRFLAHRIADKRIQRLVKGWLRAGVMEDGARHQTWVGTPQGGVISPLLANIYLHYVLDLWVHQWRKRHARGEVCIVRYADDFVVGFQYQNDGYQLKQHLKQRLALFNLSFNEDKTHLIEFGRFAGSNRRQRGARKPETFDFLGFTHICSRRLSDGKFRLLRHSIKKKLRAKLKEIKEILMRNRHKSPFEMGLWIQRVLTGYFNYFAVPSNSQTLNVMRTEVCKAWLKALRRRSQKGRKFNWARMKKFVQFFIPHTRVRHCYPNQRFSFRL